MKTLRLIVALLVLAGACLAQNQITWGPLVQASSCTVSTSNTFVFCFTTDGQVLISVAGNPLQSAFQPGKDGVSPQITVGTTSTLPAGSPATVTNAGTSSNVILNFGIPAGQNGTNATLLNTKWNVGIQCGKGNGTIQGGFTTPGNGFQCVLAFLSQIQ